jgi:hypothetical protein
MLQLAMMNNFEMRLAKRVPHDPEREHLMLPLHPTELGMIIAALTLTGGSASSERLLNKLRYLDTTTYLGGQMDQAARRKLEELHAILKET